MVDLDPPPPIVVISGRGSRSISIDWSITEPVYRKSFELYLNDRLVGNVSESTAAYNYAQLLPNRK
jgi:hypothetical protein